MGKKDQGVIAQVYWSSRFGAGKSSRIRDGKVAGRTIKSGCEFGNGVNNQASNRIIPKTGRRREFAENPENQREQITPPA